MNILYFIPNIKINSGGIYPYLITVLNIFEKKKEPNLYFFLYCQNPSVEIVELSQRNQHFFLIPANEINTETNGIMTSLENISRKVASKINVSLKPPLSNLDKIIQKYRIDIIYSPFQEIPLDINIPQICTMHDLQELHFPEFFSPEERAWRAVNYNLFIKKSAAVIVSYEHIKADIIKYFQKESRDVHVCLLDMQNLWFEKFLKEPINAESKYATQNYILYPAATWEHKNHINLIKALAIYREKYKVDLHLYCTGNITTYYKENIEPIIAQHNLQKVVHFLGIVNEIDLFDLYKNAKAIVVPTLYEAGSFPLMESILMNIPVVCSNTTSLPATIGDERFVFNPHDTDEMAEKLFRITQNPEYIFENSQNNIKAATNLIKNDFAKKMISIFNSILSKNL